MESKIFSVSLEDSPRISINVIPGHFTTSNAHVNFYLDVGGLKSSALAARDAARALAVPYFSSTPVDTIVCMEKTAAIGAYLAEELTHEGASAINSGNDIHVISPISNVNNNLVFPDSMLQWITGRNILLLVASVSSGRTVQSALECLTYYGGKVAGISALFRALPDTPGQEIHALFTAEDIQGYILSDPSQCAMCKAGVKLDAIVNSEGYTKITGQ